MALIVNEMEWLPELGQFTEFVRLGGKAFQYKDVWMGFSPCLKTCSLVTFHPNVFKLGGVGISYRLFHAVDQFFFLNLKV